MPYIPPYIPLDDLAFTSEEVDRASAPTTARQDLAPGDPARESQRRSRRLATAHCDANLAAELVPAAAVIVTPPAGGTATSDMGFGHEASLHTVRQPGVSHIRSFMRSALRSHKRSAALRSCG